MFFLYNAPVIFKEIIPMNNLILEPFNLVFWAFFAITALLAALLRLMCKGKDRKQVRTILGIAYGIALVLYFVYKYMLSIDPDYSAITVAAGLDAFSWWDELPFQLCNINLILILLATWKDSKALYSFVFFTSTLGAAMALLMPSTGFSGYSVFLPRILGYYFTHFAVLMEMPLLAATGLYKPKKQDIPKAVGMVLLILVIVTGIDFALIWSGLNPGANYFFSMGAELNPILEILWGWIPIPCIYLLPTVVILVPYMCLITWIFGGFRKPKNKYAGF